MRKICGRQIGSTMRRDAATGVTDCRRLRWNETRLGIPLLFGYDVIHGFRTGDADPAVRKACAWEPALWEKTEDCSKRSHGIRDPYTFAAHGGCGQGCLVGRRISEGAGEDVL